jgi:hypothetical protein
MAAGIVVDADLATTRVGNRNPPVRKPEGIGRAVQFVIRIPAGRADGKDGLLRETPNGFLWGALRARINLRAPCQLRTEQKAD